MSDVNNAIKSALTQVALAMVPHLAEELLTAVAAHFNNTAPAAKPQTLAEVAAADAAREDAAASITTETKTDEKPTARSRRRSAPADAGADTKAEEPAPAETAPAKGRRRRTTTAAEPEVKEEPKLIADNGEQAALRSQLIEDLGDLADVEEAHDEVRQILAEAGANTVHDIPSAAIAVAAEKAQALIEKYFAEEDAE